MKKYYITREDLENLHNMALEAEADKSISLTSSKEAYREGYLDSYNRFKFLLKELINKPSETTNEQPILKDHEEIAKHDCYCGTIKRGQVYNKLTCDLGCMYPGA